MVSTGERTQTSFEGKGYFHPTDRSAPSADALGMPIPPIIHFSTGAQAVEVEVDAETGTVQVLHMAPGIRCGSCPESGYRTSSNEGRRCSGSQHGAIGTNSI